MGPWVIIEYSSCCRCWAILKTHVFLRKNHLLGYALLSVGHMRTRRLSVWNQASAAHKLYEIPNIPEKSIQWASFSVKSHFFCPDLSVRSLNLKRTKKWISHLTKVSFYMFSFAACLQLNPNFFHRLLLFRHQFQCRRRRRRLRYMSWDGGKFFN